MQSMWAHPVECLKESENAKWVHSVEGVFEIRLVCSIIFYIFIFHIVCMFRHDIPA